MKYDNWINGCGCGCHHDCSECNCEEIYAQLSNLHTDDLVLQDNIDALSGAVEDKQDKLESGVNIKTINGESLLGEGNIDISGGTGSNVSFAVVGTKLVITTT